MQKLVMEIKCNNNTFYYNAYNVHPPRPKEVDFQGVAKLKRAPESVDIFVRRPIADKKATGLRGFMRKVKIYAKNYVRNIQHTYDHKIVFAMVEKELFGKNSIDSLTHDLDKLILYALGFPKSFVSDWHRKHSVHHVESGKKPNLRSMICDNIASSPEFKPEKKKSLREHFNTCPSLQKVKGFREILEKYNFGENLDFDKIKTEKARKYAGLHGIALIATKTLLLGLTN